MRDAVFAEEDTKGRSRTDVILNLWNMSIRS